jgi:hypothetical protein
MAEEKETTVESLCDIITKKDDDNKIYAVLCEIRNTMDGMGTSLQSISECANLQIARDRAKDDNNKWDRLYKICLEHGNCDSYNCPDFIKEIKYRNTNIYSFNKACYRLQDEISYSPNGRELREFICKD